MNKIFDDIVIPRISTSLNWPVGYAPAISCITKFTFETELNTGVHEFFSIVIHITTAIRATSTIIFAEYRMCCFMKQGSKQLTMIVEKVRGYSNLVGSAAMLIKPG